MMLRTGHVVLVVHNLAVHASALVALQYRTRLPCAPYCLPTATKAAWLLLVSYTARQGHLDSKIRAGKGLRRAQGWVCAAAPQRGPGAAGLPRLPRQLQTFRLWAIKPRTEPSITKLLLQKSKLAQQSKTKVPSKPSQVSHTSSPRPKVRARGANSRTVECTNVRSTASTQHEFVVPKARSRAKHQGGRARP